MVVCLRRPTRSPSSRRPPLAAESRRPRPRPPSVQNGMKALSICDALPDEMIALIMSFLTDCHSLGQASLACRKFHNLSCGVSLLDVSMPATILRSEAGQTVVRELLKCTVSLRVTNGTSHTGRFCKLGAPGRASGFSLCGSLLNSGVEVLVLAAGSLRVLDLSTSGHLTCASMVSVLSHCRHLERLLCRGCWSITRQLAATRCLENMSPSKSLRTLDLSHTDTGDADLVVLLAKLGSLVELDVNFCCRLTDAWFEALPQTLLRLRTLGCCQLSFGQLQRVGQTLELQSDDSFVDAALNPSLKMGGISSADALTQMLMSYNREAME
jgi:hypothetical protein